MRVYASCEFAGKTGPIVIGQNADRLNTFDVYTFGPGNDSYYRYMTIDLAKPATQASDDTFIGPIIIIIIFYNNLTRAFNVEIFLESFR
jgi:hypothetical protein